MGSKKKVIAAATLVLLLVGLVAAVILVRQRQELEKKAAVPEGVAQIRLDPESQTVVVGESLTADIVFNSTGIAISAVTVQLDYPYVGNEPAITVSDIQVNAALTSQGWSYPITTFVAENGNARVRIAAINVTTSGFISEDDNVLGTLVLQANSPGVVHMTFDSTESKVSTKTTAEDILFIPTSTGTYTAEEVVVEPTPTPTTRVLQPTATPTQPVSEPTPTPTPTPTSQVVGPTSTPTPTPGQGGILDLTPTPTSTPKPTATPTSKPTATPTPTPTTSSSSSGTGGVTAVKITSIADGQSVSDTTPAISGTSAPNASISIRITSETVTGSTTANSSGYWSWTPSTALAGGSHLLTVTATDSEANVTTDSVTFTVVTATGEAELPETASSLPLIVLSFLGGLLLVAGVGLRLAVGKSE